MTTEQSDEQHGTAGRTAGSLRRSAPPADKNPVTNHATSCTRTCWHVIGTVKAPQHGPFLEHKAGQEFAMCCCWCGVVQAALSGAALSEDDFERFPPANA
jgi:hypothetical protein